MRTAIVAVALIALCATAWAAPVQHPPGSTVAHTRDKSYIPPAGFPRDPYPYGMPDGTIDQDGDMRLDNNWWSYVGSGTYSTPLATMRVVYYYDDGELKYMLFVKSGSHGTYFLVQHGTATVG